MRRLLSAIITVFLGLTPVSADESGHISGLFTTAEGPVADVRVLAKSQTNPAHSVRTVTAVNGRFSLRALAGEYKLQFQPPGRLDQWASGRETEWAADVVTVESGATVLVEEKALPVGRIEGRVTDASGGPAAFAGVVVEDPSLDRRFQATTGADGRWSVTVRPGAYAVWFSTSEQAQRAPEPVVVARDKTTVADATLAATGSLSARAVDAGSGTPVMSFCADAHTDHVFVFACTDNGVADFGAVGPGAYKVSVNDGQHLKASIDDVTVSSGVATPVTVAMRHGATIRVSVSDAETGDPVGGVCLNGRPADTATEFGGYVGDCSDPSGMLTLTRVTLGRYVFFAAVFDGVHGAQWVGPGGGAGSQDGAAVVTAAEGGTASLSVRLDRQGSITGVITDEVTGAPVDGVEVSAGGTATVSGPDGRYELQGLGPYPWKVFFGRQWSGGGASRAEAVPVPVRANGSTIHDVALRRGAVLTGRITGLAGQPPDFAEVEVVNAKTFDVLSHLEIGPDGAFSVRLAGPQEVKLHIVAAVSGRSFVGWYPAASGFDGGHRVPIPETGTVTVDIRL